MKLPNRISIGKVLSWRPSLVLTVAVCLAAPCLYGQATTPDDSQAGVMNSLDPSTTYPIETQMVETSNLNTLNENADTVKYSDNALTRGPLFLSVEATGTGTTNLKYTFDNQPSTSGAYFSIGVPAGVHLSTPATDFVGYFRFDTHLYPGNSDLNHSSEVYSHQMIHRFSDITTSSWSLAGGHVVTLGQYLSPVIGVGSTGVLAPQESSGLQPLTDAATTYTLSHQTSERDTITASGTAGFLDQPVIGSTTNNVTKYQQLTGGGDVQWQRTLNSREVAGVELSNVYIAGLSPTGSGNFATAKFTFGQTLTPHSSITGGIGPLYTRSNVNGTPDEHSLTYAANIGFNYRRPFGGISGGFSRVYELGYITSASVANEFYFTFDRPLSSRLLVTTASQYVQNAAFEGRNNYAQFVFTARLDMHLTQSLDYHVEGSSFVQDTGAPTPGYNDNEISTGFTFYLGSPRSRSGDQ
jgi:hypothetical protein